ncbi:MAG: type 1 glutamine amidotransferase [Planctomycetota bacterium]
MAILVFQHDDRCRPGRLGLTLRDHTFKLRIVRPDQGEQPPVDYDDVDAVISLGGPQMVTDGHAWIEREQEYIRGAHERSLPVIGVCLGHQMVASALGGEVGPMDRPEIGFVDVDVLPAGHTDSILSGVAWRSPQFQKHRQEVKSLPPGAVKLASSKQCDVQIFRAGMRTYGFQYHFECDRAMIDVLLADAKTDLHQAGVTTEEFARQCDEKYEMFARLADRTCINIATYLIPRVATAMRT